MQRGNGFEVAVPNAVKEPNSAGSHSLAIRLTISYVVLAALWVILSDRIAGFIASQPHAVSELHMLRDVLFVLGSAAFLYYLAAAETREWLAIRSQIDVAERNYRRLVDQAPQAIALVDRGGIIRYANSAAAAMFGAPDCETLIGQSFLPFNGPRDAGTPGEWIRRVFNGEAHVLQQMLRFHRLDGTVGTGVFSAIPLIYCGEPMMQLLAPDIAERGRTEEAHGHADREIDRLAYYDALTGLPNRALLTDALAKAIEKAKGQSLCVSLLLVEVCRFSDINHALGYDYGDRLLRDVAVRIHGALSGEQLAARLGAAVFAILTPFLSSQKEAVRLARELVEKIEKTTTALGDIPTDVKLYAGMATYPEHGGSAEMLLRRAEIAKAASERSHAALVTYHPDQEADSDSLTLILQLRQALEAHNLVVAYQPKIFLESGLIAGVEALVRWQHPEKGLIPPTDFIPAAERTGLVSQITHYVVNAALEDAARWRTAGLDLAVCVNVGIRDLYEPGFIPWVASKLQERGGQPGNLVLELNETLLMEEPEHSVEILRQFGEIGVRISVDDFGSGYSSIAYLKRLPIHELKIDRSFVQNMSGSKDNELIVRSTIRLAHELGLKVAAEGVEDPATYEELKRMLCDTAQGFGIASPMPADALQEWALVHTSGSEPLPQHR